MKTRREMLEEFVAIDPNDSFSRYALALELEKAGREPEATAHFQELISRDPSYVAAYYHLGRVLSRPGHVQEARAAYKKGIAAAIAARDQRTQSEIEAALEALE